MEVIFRTNQLRRSYEQSARATRQWGADVGRKYITRISELYAVRDSQEACHLRSMRPHPLRGSRRGELSVDLTDNWRLIVTKGDTEEQKIVNEVSNHCDY